MWARVGPEGVALEEGFGCVFSVVAGSVGVGVPVATVVGVPEGLEEALVGGTVLGVGHGEHLSSLSQSGSSFFDVAVLFEATGALTITGGVVLGVGQGGHEGVTVAAALLTGGLAPHGFGGGGRGGVQSFGAAGYS